MKPEDTLLAFLKWWEAPGAVAKLKAYWDFMGNCWTIGYGHTEDVTESSVCTEAQALSFLATDALTRATILTAALTAKATQNQFDAMVSILYNIGAGRAATPTLGGRSGIIVLASGQPSTLLRLFNAGDVAGAAGQFPAWDHAGGVVSNDLYERRLAEQAIFLHGDYTGRPT